MKYSSPLCPGSCLHNTLSPSSWAECFSSETRSRPWQLQRMGAGWMSAALQPLNVAEPWPGTLPLHIPLLLHSPPTAASTLAKKLAPDFLSPCNHCPLTNQSFCMPHDPEVSWLLFGSLPVYIHQELGQPGTILWQKRVYIGKGDLTAIEPKVWGVVCNRCTKKWFCVVIVLHAIAKRQLLYSMHNKDSRDWLSLKPLLWLYFFFPFTVPKCS